MPSAAEIYLQRLWLILRGLTGWSGVVGETDPGLGLTTSEVWRIAIWTGEDLNDSDKKYTIPADQEWHILWAWVEFTTTATVGDRQLVAEIQDEWNDVIFQQRLGIVQAASLTRYYLMAPAVGDMDGFRDTDFLTTPIPPTTFLKGGDQIRMYDNNVVDPAADDMICQIQYAYRTIT